MGYSADMVQINGQERWRFCFSKSNWMEMTIIIWYAWEILNSMNTDTILGIAKSSLNTFFAYLPMVMLVIQIFCFQKYRIKELYLIAIVSILVLTVTMTSQSNSYLALWLFILACRDVNIDQLVHKLYYILVLGTFLVILLYLVGVLPNYIMYRNGYLRVSLGFAHPNTLGVRVFQAVLCHAYIRDFQLKVYHYIFYLLMGIFVYIVPNSQTAAGGIFIIMLFSAVYQLIRGRRVLLDLFFKILYGTGLFLAGFSIYFTFRDIEDYPLLKVFDEFLSSRFSVVYDVYYTYGVSWFGHKIYVTQTERALAGLTGTMFLDNAYGSILLRQGIAFCMLFFTAYFFLFYLFLKRKRYRLAIVWAVFSVYAIMETYATVLSYNFFLLFLAVLVYPNQRKDVLENEEGCRRGSLGERGEV